MMICLAKKCFTRNSMAYSVRTQDAVDCFDPEGRKEAGRQFIDQKAFKPGLGAYDKSQSAS